MIFPLNVVILNYLHSRTLQQHMIVDKSVKQYEDDCLWIATCALSCLAALIHVSTLFMRANTAMVLSFFI